MKTQGGFFLQPAEIIAMSNPNGNTPTNISANTGAANPSTTFEHEDKYSRNKIYGVKTKPIRTSLPGTC